MQYKNHINNFLNLLSSLLNITNSRVSRSQVYVCPKEIMRNITELTYAILLCDVVETSAFH